MLFLILTVCIVFNFTQCEAVEFYVRPTDVNNSRDCPSNHTCNTVSEYAANASSLLSDRNDSIAMIFLNGHHTLSNQSLVIENVTKLTISGFSMTLSAGNYQSVVQVHNSNITFRGIKELRIEHVKIVTVSRQSYTFINHSEIQHTSYHNLQIERCIMIMHVVNVPQEQNNTNISTSLIPSNYSSSYIYLSTATTVTVSISESQFTLSELKVKTAEHSQTQFFISQCKFQESSGIGIFITVGDRSSLDQIMSNTTIKKSKWQGLRIEIGKEAHVRNQIINCRITENNLSGIVMISARFSYLFMSIDGSTLESNKNGLDVLDCTRGTVTISNCVVTNNMRYGIFVAATKIFCYSESDVKTQSNALIIMIKHSSISRNMGGVKTSYAKLKNTALKFTIYNCSVSHNIANLPEVSTTSIRPSAAGFSIWSRYKVTLEIAEFLIKNVTFIDNLVSSSTTVILQIINTNNVTIEDCIFQGNRGTPIKAYSSIIVISGNTVFENNIAIQGGALSLIFSRVLLSDSSNIRFVNNTAKSVGGAIYVETYFRTITSIPDCFYTLIDKQTFNVASGSVQTSLYFSNNTAGYGGEDIYGVPVNELCIMLPTTITNKYKFGISSIFNFSRSRSSLSSISSDPMRVCLCDLQGYPQCRNLSYVLSTDERYPGERFNISVVVVGIEYGTVTSSVYAQMLHRGLYPLGPKQHSQAADYQHCNELTYSVHSYQNVETLILTASEAIVERLVDKNELISPKLWKTVPVFINITLRDCPLGFTLQGEPPSCQCHTSLQELEIGCDIIDGIGVIYRQGRVWVNASISGNNSNGVVIHRYCPYDYCKQQVTSVDLRYPDTQCALNHSGILCGGCLPNLSLTLGSNRCLHCLDNNKLALLLFFIAAGFLLVIFIKVLDVTVANGTINGLIFYANIAWTYQSVLFSNQENKQVGTETFLKAFLAWLNLDFGIETCFFVGLNPYWKTWLEFVFPIYIWSIAGLMIYASHCSRRVTRLIGNNAVQVLATIILLSYVKLLRVLTTIMGLASVNYPDRSARVWLFDGNVPYLGSQHAPLFCVSLLAIVFLLLPYVLTLLLVPCLKRKSHLKLLRWTNRWKPFYDAYYGPLKDKHHYWIGLLLFVRAFLVFIFPAVHNSTLRLAVVLTPAALLCYVWFVGHVYRKWYLSALEGTFFFNLILLGVGILVQTTIIVHISLWLLFVQFICIVLFHAGYLLKKNCNKKSLVRKQDQPKAEVGKIVEDNGSRAGSFSVELRESLLEDSNDKYN